MTHDEVKELEAKRGEAHAAKDAAEAEAARWFEAMRIAEHDHDREGWNKAHTEYEWAASQAKQAEQTFQRVVAEVDGALLAARREELASIAELCAPGSFWHRSKRKPKRSCRSTSACSKESRGSPTWAPTRGPRALA